MRTIRHYTTWVAMLGLCALATTAFAQGRGRGGPRISPEDAAKAWTVQATSVAKSLALEEADTTKLVEVYETARKAQGAAMREAMGGGGPGGDPMARFQQMRELNEKHAEGLKSSLTEAIGEESAAKAVETLAAFDRQSDGMTVALAAMGLEDAKLSDAMAHIATYASGLSKATEEAFTSMSMDKMRTAREELKTALDDGLAKILSEDQLATWKEKTTFRGRGGRGGGPLGGRGPGRPGQN